MNQPKQNIVFRSILAGLISSLLIACGSSDSTSGGDSAAVSAAATRAASLSPSDPDLKALYDQTCRNCHSSPQSGAPLTGDSAAWAPRMANGMDSLLDHTINGYKGMPPLGSCMDCSESEFEQLIRFMASAAPAQSAPQADTQGATTP